MNAYRPMLALAATLAFAACGAGAGEQRNDETTRQQQASPAPATMPAGDTTVSGQTPTADRPGLPRERDTMGAGAGTSVVPPGTN